MANFPIVTLLITLSILSPFSGAAAKHVPNKPTPEASLVEQICKNANIADPNFCRKTLNSDPRAANADRMMIGYIAFGITYSNINETQTQIQTMITEFPGNGEHGILTGLKSCNEKYMSALASVGEILGNLDSEMLASFYKLSKDAQLDVFECEAGFRGTTAGSPMSTMNAEMIKLIDICLVVSRLFS